MTIRGKIIATLIGVLVIVVLLSSYFTFACYSEGNRNGTVIKLSHKGVIFKTYEGELIQRTLSNAPGDTWYFTVTDPAIVAKINDARAHNQQVDLMYCQRFYKFFWQGETEYFVNGVTVVQ